MPTILDFLDIDLDGLTLEYTEPDQSGDSEIIFPQDLVTRRQRQVLGGASLVPLMERSVERIRDLACGGHHNQQWYAVTEQWSLLLPVGSARSPELYNLLEDSSEKHNLVTEHPEVASALELELRRFVDMLPTG